jgi:hypothetical protein
VVIVCLLIAIGALWQKVNTLNSVIVVLDEKFHQHTSDTNGLRATPTLGAPSTSVQTQVKYIQAPKKATMEQIGGKTSTDKITVHGYHRFYPYFLEPLRDVPNLKMLEIGYNLGYSYQMWLQYFPLGKVYFMEKDHGAKFPEARFTGDQGKTSDLNNLLVTKGLEGALDFIIDDGSHHPEHQMISFTYLFEHGLKPGGIYIIEDTETSYWRNGDTYGLSTVYGKDSPNSAINRLKGLIDVVNRRYQPPEEPFTSSFGKAIDSTVQSVFFGPNAVVIVKMKEDEMSKYDSSTYLWKSKLEKAKPAK